ncbi:MAG: hypothetical protein DI498_04585 [Paracoccus denitrificans]|nr:MAG: hypothetical protein DI498_04585 [Paracoccus denitrificans]PZO85211.1 MAG: hypothetical protein DI633_04585 [Paracoccus denitrificans]
MMAAGPVTAGCHDPYLTLFSCDVPERNASIEFCQLMPEHKDTGLKSNRYIYTRNGQVELTFETDTTWFAMKRSLPGMQGDPIGAAMARDGAVYAFYIPHNYEPPDNMQGQLLVYRSLDDFNVFDWDPATPIARRVCYPPSVVVETDLLGP